MSTHQNNDRFYLNRTASKYNLAFKISKFICHRCNVEWTFDLQPKSFLFICQGSVHRLLGYPDIVIWTPRREDGCSRNMCLVVVYNLT